MNKLVEITIPVLNEEKTLREQILKLLAHLNSIASERYRYRICIANNGSTDLTEKISLELIEENPGLIEYIEVGQRGVGLALKTSWEKSNADIIGYMDLDFATGLQHLEEAVHEISFNNYDFAYGTRLHKNSTVIGRTAKRELVSRIFNYMLKIYLHTSISDGMCGFKFFKRSLLRQILSGGANSNGWFFCTEILLVSEHKGYRLFELPVSWTDDADSRVNISKLAREYIMAMRVIKKSLRSK
jgi:glycosyltransferase involved in cell wall biosynthesis